MKEQLSSPPNFETGGFFSNKDRFREQHYLQSSILDSLINLNSVMRDSSGEIINIMSPAQQSFLSRFKFPSTFELLFPYIPHIISVRCLMSIVFFIDKAVSFARLAIKKGIATAIYTFFCPTNSAIGFQDKLESKIPEKPTTEQTNNFNFCMAESQQLARNSFLK